MRMTPIILALVLVAFASHSEARTWRVEADGSGDWRFIQTAVEASASGDTILIGPGRYDQLHDGPYGQTGVAYWNAPKNLTFIGESRETVVIGPSSFVLNSNGLWCEGGGAYTVITNITFENLEYASTLTGGGAISASNIRGCEQGFIVFGQPAYAELEVVGCEFIAKEEVISGNFLSARNLNDVSIIQCSTTDMMVYLQDVAQGVVRDCEFNNPIYPSLTNFNRSNVDFSNNVINKGRVGAQNACTVVLRNNYFSPNTNNSSSVSGSHDGLLLNLFDNVFEGGGFATISIQFGASVIGSGNHILNGGSEHTVYVNGNQPSDEALIDLRNNYWGVTDSTAIADLILDVNDDPGRYSEVLFMPFATEPLATEKKSLGNFKSMFR